MLLGLSLDARARYLAANHRFKGACRDYRHAMQICQEEQGESHPQVIDFHFCVEQYIGFQYERLIKMF